MDNNYSRDPLRYSWELLGSRLTITLGKHGGGQTMTSILGNHGDDYSRGSLGRSGDDYSKEPYATVSDY